MRRSEKPSRGAKPARATPPRRTGRTPGAAGWLRDEEVPDTLLLPAVLAAASGVLALWPYTSVIEPGGWSFAAAAVIVTAALTGLAVRSLTRRRREWMRDTLTLLAQAVIAIAVITAIVGGDTALFGVLPTERTWMLFGELSTRAWDEVAHGSAPLASSPGLRLVLAAGFAVVAILLDQLLALRLALLAWMLTAAVGALPMIITFGGANVVWFVLLGVLMLILLRYAARRHPQAPSRTSPPIVAGVGVFAIAATVIVAPGLPISQGWASTGTGVSVSASLRLGDDLRRPMPVEVLTIAAKSEAPYLRLATLSRFDGRIWHPDEDPLTAQSEGFGAPDWSDEVATKERSTSIRVLRVSSSWLPVPYPATDVEGAPASWRVMSSNRTLVAATDDAIGSDYTVTSLEVTPTLEQIRAVSAATVPPPADDEEPELPAMIGELAAEVTAEAATDYDRLIALQNWFRAEFQYSLETPVEEGFDGTGADAVVQFLEERAGYCVHFAGAFALMAQSMDMQVRIVVGYLPGTKTDQKRGDETVYSVSSDQLHSWPEVFFPGIGWVPFEPTASLGVPTRFIAGTTGGSGVQTPTTPAPTSSPRATSTSGPSVEREDAGDNAATTGALRRLDPTPVLLSVGGTILVLLLPALIRLSRSALRRRRARQGDAMAAWTELRDVLVDLRLPVSDADTVRVRGASLVRERGVDATAMGVLIDAVEQVSYARPGAGSPDLAPSLAEVVKAIRRSVDARSRLRALLVPRSLFAARGADAPVLA